MTSATPLLTVREDLTKNLNTACQQIIEWETKQAAAGTLLRDIVPAGVRVSALESRGVRTVAQASGLTYAKMTSFNGVGPRTASGVIAAVNSFPQLIASKVRLLPNPDRPRPADVPLILALEELAVFRREIAPVLANALAEIAQAHGAAEKVLGESGPFRLTLSAGRRGQAASEGPRIGAVVEAATTRAARLVALIQPKNAPPQDVWRRYSLNNAQYVAMLEQYGPGGYEAHARRTSHLAPGSPLPPPLPPAAVVVGQTRPLTASPKATSSTNLGRGAPAFTPARPSQAPPSAPFALAPDPLGGLPPELAAQIEAVDLFTGPLVASLRRYQQFGARFLALRRRAILGDDMGLGKTIQVLAVMCHLNAQGGRHFVVVAPNSVVINWEREVRKHTALTPFIAHGDPRVKHEAVMTWNAVGGVLITTYGTFPNLAPSIGPVDLFAVDEAHMVKNPNAVRTRAVRDVASRSLHLALLTGTALENRLSELGELVTLTNPDLRSLISQLSWAQRPDPVTVRQRLAPVYLRRTQRDVLTELPPLTQIVEFIEPTSADAAACAAGVGGVMAMRRAAAYGAGTAQAAKFARLRELFDTYRAEGRKVVVFSFFRDVLDLASYVAGGCEQVTGDTAPGHRQTIIDKFGEIDGFAVLACQIEAGGLGINLQAAQVVVLMEPQLKPSSEHQAIARVRRMGQTRSVNVHRMVLKNSIEERIVELVRYKQQIFDDFADPSALKDESAMAVDGSSLSLEAELAMLIERGTGLR